MVNEGRESCSYGEDGAATRKGDRARVIVFIGSTTMEEDEKTGWRSRETGMIL